MLSIAANDLFLKKIAMSTYILALDQGTTSSRAIIFNEKGAIVSMAQKEFEQIYPNPGWVEHNAKEIWDSQYLVAVEALQKVNLKKEDIAAIGITNQRETTVVWDRQTGEPIYNAIVWQDKRTADYCDELKQKGWSRTIQSKTGLVIDAYFSGTKLKWILDHVAGARERAEKGDLCFGTVDSWLVFKLTHGAVHATDVSNASRTMLFNIHTLDWDHDLLSELNIPPQILPEVKSSSEVYGKVQNNEPLNNIAIAGIAGDQQAALFGQLCTRPGMVKNTYGTGCFMLLNTGDKAVSSKNNLLTTIAWKINGKTEYALEGSVFIAGAVVQWLRDELGIIQSSADVEALALKVNDTNGVYLVPAFVGLGAPYWKQNVRGTITGLTRGSNKSHIARAAIESIAYQTVDVLKAMEADSGISIQELRVDGGATANDLLMQFQSDLLGCKVVRPIITETTALGAAYLAGLAVGYWQNIEAIQSQWQIAKSFSPAMDAEQKESLLKGWEKAVQLTIGD
jgi:glycerol kinase